MEFIGLLDYYMNTEKKRHRPQLGSTVFKRLGSIYYCFGIQISVSLTFPNYYANFKNNSWISTTNIKMLFGNYSL